MGIMLLAGILQKLKSIFVSWRLFAMNSASNFSPCSLNYTPINSRLPRWPLGVSDKRRSCVISGLTLQCSIRSFSRLAGIYLDRSLFKASKDLGPISSLAKVSIFTFFCRQRPEIIAAKSSSVRPLSLMKTFWIKSSSILHACINPTHYPSCKV